VVITVVLAFMLPLALTLRSRARAELETQGLVRAQSIAQQVGGENMGHARRASLTAIVTQAEARVGGRVIVVDASGRLVADSQGPATLQLYASSGRPEIVAALTGQPTSEIRYSTDLGETIMVTAVPIVDETTSAPGAAPVVGAVRISTSMAGVDENVRRTLLGLLAIGGAGLLAGLILAFALANSFSRPLAKLTATAARLGKGDLTVRVGPVSGGREIEGLAHSFDEMAERVEGSAQAQREFIANASHQLRTPLTGMKLRLESAIERTDDGDIRSQLVAADQEVDRLAATVSELLVLGQRAETGEVAPVDLERAARRAVDRWGVRSESMDATLRLQGSGGVVRIASTDLDQIFDNLLDNAIVHAAGAIDVMVEANGGMSRLSVQDHGRGISPEDLQHVTKRFFRGRGAVPGGSGLGLAIVRELTERWGGTVSVQSPDGQGTRVEVSFPTAS
jgi:signal transduction histidine kinase